MPQSGSKLLHYRLIEKIGQGGMGVVWKAVDTTLDREVAIKVLPAQLAGDADRVARLEREAKLLGSLNHPNVATVHGLHVDSDPEGTRFLVMELVDGEDLSARLARGAVPHDEAVEIARQIAEGLEAAHAAGVIHRDLKPANVKVTGDGRVKVLDFGLARAFENRPPSGHSELSPTRSPTLTSAGTLAGTILGTAAYMSPEQARGHPVDGRTDVWAFGVVLYEMLSGRAAFKAETVSDTLASVLKVEPDLDALPPDVPRRVRRLINRCLQKNRKDRLHHIADARILLEEAQAGGPETPAPAPGRSLERGMWLAGLVLVGVAAAFAAWILRPSAAPPPHRKIVLALDGEDPDDPKLKGQEISPDGTRLVYRNGRKVFVRDLDDWASREIAGAAGGSGVFWSPDSASLGFLRDKALWRVSPDGGAASKIADLPGSMGSPSWGSDGAIVMTGEVDEQAGLWAVPARGGDVKKVLLAEGTTHFHGCQVLPDGRGVLTALHARPEMQIGVLADGEFKQLFALDTTHLPDPVYASTGHVLYFRGGTNVGVWARPFSLNKLEFTGEPFLVAAGAGSFSVSRDGTLVHTPSTDSYNQRLVWVDRAGDIVEDIGTVQTGMAHPSLSPDDGRVAARVGPDDDKDIWVLDLARGTQTRLTFEDGPEYRPAWTPDGKRVLYVHDVGDEEFVTIRNADGTGEPERLAEADEFSLSPDGRYLITVSRSKEQKGDLWLHDLESEDDADAVPFVATAADEIESRVSPDGEYIAYASDESGRYEVYLKRFPSGTGKWQASVEGGSVPRWHPQGGELFWQNDGTMMRVDVETTPSLTLGTPSALFSWEPGWILGAYYFDVSNDGQRFVLVTSESAVQSKPNQVMLVENWLSGL